MIPYHYYLYPIYDDAQEPDEDEHSVESQPEPDPVFPWLIPQPQTESEPDVTSVTPMINIISSNPPSEDSPHDYVDPLASQPTGQASSSDSGGQGSAGSTQMEELPDIAEVQENRIDPADIKFYLAAQHNPVLNEIQFMCRQENIPLVWQSHRDIVISS